MFRPARLINDLTIGSSNLPFHCISLALAIRFAVLFVDAEPVVLPTREGGIRPARQSEIIYEGMVSYGNYRLFAAAENAKLYAAGVEYDR